MQRARDFWSRFLRTAAFLILMVLAACGGVTPPVPTLSPPVLDATGTLLGEDFVVKGLVSRPQGQSVTGIIITITNVTQQNQIETVVNPNGTFTQGIPGVPGNLIRIVARDPSTQQLSNKVEAIIPYSGGIRFGETPVTSQQMNAVLQVIQGFLLTPQ